MNSITPCLTGRDPDTYVPSALHDSGRNYVESNCYLDVIIELLAARGLDPVAMLGCCLRADFEGDQFSFIKPWPQDLELLYGVDIHEMQPYRDLRMQALEQLAADRTLIVEFDAYHLPDTAATTYQREHVKTSVAIEALDDDAQRLRYFHGTGLHELEGADYRAVFGLGGRAADWMPPYVELARFDAGGPADGEMLRRRAVGCTRLHLAARPASNPFERFGERLVADLPALLEADATTYHDYAFATVRMAGAAMELCGDHVAWLLGDAAAPAREHFAAVVEGCKVLSFRLARRRSFAPDEAVAAMASAWDRAMGVLDELLA